MRNECLEQGKSALNLSSNPFENTDHQSADFDRPENMLAALEALRREHGSVEKYVINKCAISPDTIAQLRKNLIVPDLSVEI